MLSTSFQWCHPLVLLGAGQGRRLGAEGEGRPKLLLPLSGDGVDPPRTVLDGIVSAWRARTSELWVVAAEPLGPLEEALARLDVESRVVVQPRPDGTLNALMLLRDHLPERFTVLLGDCLLGGHLQGPAEPFRGIGVWEDAPPEAVQDNYAVILRDGGVGAVQEKPADPADGLCGMGVYFLDGDFLEAVGDLPADGQGRREMTDALGFYVAGGGELEVARLRGDYVNVNRPADLQRARRLFGAP